MGLGLIQQGSARSSRVWQPPNWEGGISGESGVDGLATMGKGGGGGGRRTVVAVGMREVRANLPHYAHAHGHGLTCDPHAITLTTSPLLASHFALTHQTRGSWLTVLFYEVNTSDVGLYFGPHIPAFAIDVCEGMEYLHQNNIIHRDLKTANLLMDVDHVVKVADFGVARFQSQGGVMTAETGTYRWMAPEVINHQPYDQKADVFSFAIVLWELITAKVDRNIRSNADQGLRPELPENAHPKLLSLMQRCWEADPSNRPSFSEITFELVEILQEVQGQSPS
ncbi:hypothetical protein Scep_002313 [Stephania cephalantha]|uniref:Protein kinase domain-containing protein n=1 Tax=Stephania cephalantha TaxID=152367 RepID=A0AAP0Q467_9MAGN